jgi:hypothetical protein
VKLLVGLDCVGLCEHGNKYSDFIQSEISGRAERQYVLKCEVTQ